MELVVVFLILVAGIAAIGYINRKPVDHLTKDKINQNLKDSGNDLRLK